MPATPLVLAALVSTLGLAQAPAPVSLRSAEGASDQRASRSARARSPLEYERAWFQFVPDVFRGACDSGDAALPFAVAPGGGAHMAHGVTLFGARDVEAAEVRSAGWRNTFVLEDGGSLRLSLHFELSLAGARELTDRAEFLLDVDGELRGPVTSDFVARLVGGVEQERSTGRRHVMLEVGPLEAGEHTVTLGLAARGLDERSHAALVFETPTIEVVPGHAAIEDASSFPLTGLSFERFRRNIRDLARLGDRDIRDASNMTAQDWLFDELQACGYEVASHTFTFGPESRRSIYVTRTGSVAPDRMYIVSAHLDGIGGGGAADDDASGCSLVLELARLFARPDFECDISVRFVFWNGEEWNLVGSDKYVRDRALLQGIEDPNEPGSYPEPVWLGIVQHDMILFDHGLPPGPEQSPLADIDVEYRHDAFEARAGLALAHALKRGNLAFASTYPLEVSDLMSSTDSVSFQDLTAAVSVRENRRLAELGLGANPHWHQSSDVFATYSEADFRLGFDTLKSTLGAILELSGGRFQGPTGLEQR